MCSLLMRGNRINVTIVVGEQKKNSGNGHDILYVKKSNSFPQLGKQFLQEFTSGCQDRFVRLFLILFLLLPRHTLAVAFSYLTLTSETFCCTIRLSCDCTVPSNFQFLHLLTSRGGDVTDHWTLT